MDMILEVYSNKKDLEIANNLDKKIGNFKNEGFEYSGVSPWAEVFTPEIIHTPSGRDLTPCYLELVPYFKLKFGEKRDIEDLKALEYWRLIQEDHNF